MKKPPSVNTSGRAKVKRIEETKRLYHQGYTDQRIAEMICVTVDAIKKYRISAGLYRRGVRGSKWGRYTRTVPADSSQPEPSTTAKKRKCLRCEAEFDSSWAGERICNKCHGSHAWKTGGDFSLGSRL